MFVFGFLGQDTWARIDRTDIQLGHFVAPAVEQSAPISGFVRDVPAQLGDRVHVGDTLSTFSQPGSRSGVGRDRGPTQCGTGGARCGTARRLI